MNDKDINLLAYAMHNHFDSTFDRAVVIENWLKNYKQEIEKEARLDELRRARVIENKHGAVYIGHEVTIDKVISYNERLAILQND